MFRSINLTLSKIKKMSRALQGSGFNSLMRIVAFILELCICAFIGETILLSAQCIDSVSKPSCSVTAKAGMTHCTKKLPVDTRPSQKHANCMDCPMFALATYQPHMLTLKPIQLVKQGFALLEMNGLADYHSLAWKPPDFIFST
jgi:hypothetical protein